MSKQQCRFASWKAEPRLVNRYAPGVTYMTTHEQRAVRVLKNTTAPLNSNKAPEGKCFYIAILFGKGTKARPLGARWVRYYRHIKTKVEHVTLSSKQMQGYTWNTNIEIG